MMRRKQLLDEGGDALGLAQIESAHLNAQELLAFAQGMGSRLDVLRELQAEVSEQAERRFRELLKQRADGVPLQHLLGEVEFFAHCFKTDARALIPRPETEVLVELCLAEIEQLDCHNQQGLVVDVGTGSGCIALSLAAARPWARVVGLDLSPQALDLARENLAFLSDQGVSNLPKRVEFLASDLLDSVASEQEILLLVANLPYIARGELAGLSREVSFDPVMALDGGEDGLDLVRKLCAQLALRKERVGIVALEVGYDQGARSEDLLREAGFEQVRLAKDLQGVARFVLGRGGGG